MRRTLIVLAALAFGLGAAAAQTASGSSGDNQSAETTQQVKKKKKGREWGRFSSQRVDDNSQNSPPRPKVGASPRLD